MKQVLPRLAAAAVALAAGLISVPAAAQGPVTGAQLTREQKPTYPEGLLKIQKQGNVLLTGRIDRSGKVQDIQAVAATNLGFVDSAIAAVKAWQFRPAARGGKPVDIATNIALRFRLEGPKRGEIPRPILGDLSIFPANAAGARSGPEGFPIRRGGDPRLRTEAVLDVPPPAKPQKLAVRADAVSPTGRKINLYSATLAAPAGAHDVKVAFSAPVGTDWEDGIWSLELTVDEVPAGGGQFWLAGDPEHFDFASIAAKNAARASAAPPVVAPTPKGGLPPTAVPKAAPPKPPPGSKKA